MKSVGERGREREGVGERERGSMAALRCAFTCNATSRIAMYAPCNVWAAAGRRNTTSTAGAGAGAAAGAGASGDQKGDDGESTFGFRRVARSEKAGMVGDVFTRVSGYYDLMNDLMSAGLHRAWKDRLVSRLRPFPGQTHLDVAGGTGDVGLRVLHAIRVAEREAQKKHSPPADAGEQTPTLGTVTVSDINADMLEVGKRDMHAKWRKLNSGIGPFEARSARSDRAVDIGDGGIRWVQADAENLPFADDRCVTRQRGRLSVSVVYIPLPRPYVTATDAHNFCSVPVLLLSIKMQL